MSEEGALDPSPQPSRPSKARGCLYRLLALAFGLAIACGVLEIGSRILYAQIADQTIKSIAADPTNILNIYKPDHRMGWVYKPGASVTVDEASAEAHTVTISQHSLYDLDYSYERPAKGFRVLVLGDSYVESIQVALHQRSFQMLEDRYQEESTTPYEIIEMGVGNYSPAQYYQMYSREGERYHPDVVIVLVYGGNDIEGLYSDPGHNLVHVLTGPTTTYTLDNGKLVEVDLPDWRPPTGSSHVPVQTPFLRWVDLTLRRYSVGYSVIGSNFYRSQQGVDLGIAGGHIALARRFEANYQDPQDEQAWPIFKALLLALRDAATKDGSQFAVVIAPEMYAIYPDWYFQDFPAAKKYRSLFDARKMDRQVEAFLKENAINTLNLTPDLQAAALTSDEPLYSHTHTHWTPAGHAVVAGALAKWFAKMGWSPSEK